MRIREVAPQPEIYPDLTDDQHATDLYTVQEFKELEPHFISRARSLHTPFPGYQFDYAYKSALGDLHQSIAKTPARIETPTHTIGRVVDSLRDLEVPDRRLQKASMMLNDLLHEGIAQHVLHINKTLGRLGIIYYGIQNEATSYLDREARRTGNTWLDQPGYNPEDGVRVARLMRCISVQSLRPLFVVQGKEGTYQHSLGPLDSWYADSRKLLRPDLQSA